MEDFVVILKTSPVKNEEDVMLHYYNRLLLTSEPLYNSEQLTDEQRNAEFFTKDRDILACCTKGLKSNHPVDGLARRPLGSSKIPRPRELPLLRVLPTMSLRQNLTTFKRTNIS
jgi:hypothetical protein